MNNTITEQIKSIIMADAPAQIAHNWELECRDFVAAPHRGLTVVNRANDAAPSIMLVVLSQLSEADNGRFVMWRCCLKTTRSDDMAVTEASGFSRDLEFMVKLLRKVRRGIRDAGGILC